MLTVPQKIAIAEISQYLCVVYIEKGGLNGNGMDLLLPRKIECIRKSIQYRYDRTPNDATLEETSNYLLAICALVYLPASIIAATSTGGGSTSIGGRQAFPIYITKANFTTATFYPNTNISGNNILIFYNQIPRYLLPDEFTISAAGITIDMPGFDATTQEIDLVIEKVY